MWKTIETAPKGKYEKRIVMREGKQIEMEEFVSPKVLLALNGEVYLTRALASGRWMGFSEKDKPTHYMVVPYLPVAGTP